MRVLKIVGIVLMIIIGVPLIVALFVPKDVQYEKSIEINAPIQVVWENVNSLSDMDKWSPWNQYDPTMKKEIIGKDGTVGAKQVWESNVDEVGKGSQTIAKLNAPNLIETDLKFFSPYESEAKGYVKLKEKNNKTLATWGFASEMPYPMNLMKLFTNMEDMMDKDWNDGLSKLKEISEN